MPNKYQLAKARRIARFIEECAARTKEATTPFELSRMVALFTMDEWRTIAFAAGEAAVDLDTKAAVLHIFQTRVPHIIGRKEAA